MHTALATYTAIMRAHDAAPDANTPHRELVQRGIPSHVIIPTGDRATMRVLNTRQRLSAMADLVRKQWALFGGGPKPAEFARPKPAAMRWSATAVSVWAQQMEAGAVHEATVIALEKLGARFSTQGREAWMAIAPVPVPGLPARIVSARRDDGKWMVCDWMSGLKLSERVHGSRVAAVRDALRRVEIFGADALAAKLAQTPAEDQAAAMAAWCAARGLDQSDLPQPGPDVPAWCECADSDPAADAPEPDPEPAQVAADPASARGETGTAAGGSDPGPAADPPTPCGDIVAPTPCGDIGAAAVIVYSEASPSEPISPRRPEFDKPCHVAIGDRVTAAHGLVPVGTVTALHQIDVTSAACRWQMWEADVTSDSGVSSRMYTGILTVLPAVPSGTNAGPGPHGTIRTPDPARPAPAAAAPGPDPDPAAAIPDHLTPCSATSALTPCSAIGEDTPCDPQKQQRPRPPSLMDGSRGTWRHPRLAGGMSACRAGPQPAFIGTGRSGGYRTGNAPAWSGWMRMTGGANRIRSPSRRSQCYPIRADPLSTFLQICPIRPPMLSVPRAWQPDTRKLKRPKRQGSAIAAAGQRMSGPMGCSPPGQSTGTAGRCTCWPPISTRGSGWRSGEGAPCSAINGACHE